MFVRAGFPKKPLHFKKEKPSEVFGANQEIRTPSFFTSPSHSSFSWHRALPGGFCGAVSTSFPSAVVGPEWWGVPRPCMTPSWAPPAPAPHISSQAKELGLGKTKGDFRLWFSLQTQLKLRHSGWKWQIRHWICLGSWASQQLVHGAVGEREMPGTAHISHTFSHKQTSWVNKMVNRI